jgi:type IV pilus assembly protein PilP
MNQRVVFFIAIACIAQLGLVLIGQAFRQPASSPSPSFSGVSVSSNTDKSLPVDTRASLKAASTNTERKNSSTSRSSTDSPTSTTSAAKIDAGSASMPPKGLQAVSAVTGEQRNPFVPFFTIKQSAGDTSASTPESFELSELRLVATIRGPDGTYSASVETPTGKSFIIKVGSAIGTNRGQVRSISESKILISEPSADAIDDQHSVTREMTLTAKDPSTE